jgi:hypothetical protein
MEWRARVKHTLHRGLHYPGRITKTRLVVERAVGQMLDRLAGEAFRSWRTTAGSGPAQGER